MSLSIGRTLGATQPNATRHSNDTIALREWNAEKNFNHLSDAGADGAKDALTGYVYAARIIMMKMNGPEETR